MAIGAANLTGYEDIAFVSTSENKQLSVWKLPILCYFQFYLYYHHALNFAISHESCVYITDPPHTYITAASHNALLHPKNETSPYNMYKISILFCNIYKFSKPHNLVTSHIHTAKCTIKHTFVLKMYNKAYICPCKSQQIFHVQN